MTTLARSSMTRWVVALATALLVGVFVPGLAGADTKSELASAKAKLNTLIDQIAAENKAIQGLEADIAKKQNAIEIVQGQLAQTQARIVRLQGEITTRTLKLQALQHQLNRRAWVAFENGPGSNFEFLLGSTSLSDLSDRLQIVNNASEGDKALLDEIRNQRAALTAKRQQEQKLKTQLRNQELDLVQQRAALQAQLDTAQAAYDKLSQDKAEAERQVKNLTAKRNKEIADARRAAEEARRRLLAAQGGSNGGSTEGAVGHPFTACPVDQPRGYGDDYGAPRYGGGFHPHAGNDIFAPRGTPIRAPFSGTASDHSNGLGGISVEVTGADGWVYNAHLDQIVRLGRVSAGDVIGLVGDSGDAKGGATHDHFEWHPNVIPPHPHTSPYGYSVINGSIDPYPYLNQVC